MCLIYFLGTALHTHTHTHTHTHSLHGCTYMYTPVLSLKGGWCHFCSAAFTLMHMLHDAGQQMELLSHTASAPFYLMLKEILVYLHSRWHHKTHWHDLWCLCVCVLMSVWGFCHITRTLAASLWQCWWRKPRCLGTKDIPRYVLTSTHS